jgi:hypothetical protein
MDIRLYYWTAGELIDKMEMYFLSFCSCSVLCDVFSELFSQCSQSVFVVILSGLVVNVLAITPKVLGFKSSQGQIFKDDNP